MEQMSAILIDLDGALGDTRPLWDDWLTAAAKVLGVEPARLALDRGEAAAQLDAGGAGNWRALLQRFAEERAPVYLRPDAAASAALRRVSASGRAVGIFTDAPVELAEVAVSQLGATRRVGALKAGAGALEALQRELGSDALVVSTRTALTAL